MIKHVVLFKFKPEADESECQKALDDLRQLPEKIDSIRDFEVGEDVLGSKRSWDVSLISTFDDLEALQKYINHDDHVAVALRLQAFMQAVAVVDSEQ